jgi:hypothetical protein
MEDLFRAADTDGDGQLDETEFRSILQVRVSEPCSLVVVVERTARC